MGIQALRTIVPLAKKSAIVFSFPATTAVIAPSANQIAIVTMLAAADAHRLLEVQQKVRECINYAREKTWFEDLATDIFVAIKLDGSKGSARSDTVFTNFVTGDVGITIDGATRIGGSKNWIEEAYQQTLDWMSEEARLTVPIVFATGILTAAAQVTADDTVTIQGRVYTFVAAPSAPDEIDIGALATDSLDNLIAAINNDAGEGTLYGTGTTINPYVSAAAGAGDTIDFTAKSQRPSVGNFITTTEIAAQLSWGADKLSGGS